MQQLGIITGLTLEADIVNAASRHWQAARPLVCASGPGNERACIKAQEMCAQGANALMSFGICGGLSRELSPGDLVIAKSVVNHNRKIYSCDAKWRRAISNLCGAEVNSKSGAIYSGQIVATDVAAKRRLYEETGAMAIDLESAGVARAAEEAGVPFIVARAVCDPANARLPPLTVTAVNENGALDIPAVLKSLVVHPTQIAELPELARNSGAAKASLRTLTRLAGPGFGLF